MPHADTLAVFMIAALALNALTASRATGWLRGNETTALWLQRTTGVVFVRLGMRLAVSRR